MTAKPTTTVADSPTGLNLDVHVPQNTECEAGPPVECPLATSHLKDTKVSLPEGMALNPSGANGLDGCSPAEIGLTTPLGSKPIHFTGEPANCPDASKIGTAEIETPLLEAPMPGTVYLAEPYDNPFESLLAIYIEVDDQERGFVAKFAGHGRRSEHRAADDHRRRQPQLPHRTHQAQPQAGPACAASHAAHMRGILDHGRTDAVFGARFAGCRP